MARPSKLTPELTDKLVEVFRIGQTSIESACAHVGIHPATYYRWMNENSEFCEVIEKARADAVLGYLAVIRKAANSGQWQAAAWWLERVLPEQYGRKVTTEVITRDKFMETVAALEAELAGSDT